jgi:hypothetical protein
MSLIGPAVVAAVISGIVSVIGIFLSSRTTRSVHDQRLDFERQLAEKKTNADISLEERKFEYEEDLFAFRRRTELAEEVLVGFYEARDIITWARFPGTMEGEGQTREKSALETEARSRRLNGYYAPAERLLKRHEILGKEISIPGSLFHWSRDPIRRPHEDTR